MRTYVPPRWSVIYDAFDIHIRDQRGTTLPTGVAHVSDERYASPPLASPPLPFPLLTVAFPLLSLPFLFATCAVCQVRGILAEYMPLEDFDAPGSSARVPFMSPNSNGGNGGNTYAVGRAKETQLM